jgi:hypothetical protein
LTILDASKDEGALALPVGVRVGYGQYVSDRVVRVEPPHILLGYLRADVSRDGSLDEVRAALANEAASHGANVLVISDLTDARSVGAGFYGKGAAVVLAAQQIPPPETLLEGVVSRLVGFREIGSPIKQLLTQTAPFELAVERGYCYALAFVLLPESRFDPMKYPGVHLDSDVFFVPRTSEVFGASEKAMATLRAYSTEVGCPEKNGKWTLHLEQLSGPTGPQSPQTKIGVGPVEIHIYQLAFDDAHMAARKAERNRALDRACDSCEEELKSCFRPRASLCKEYVHCLEITSPEFDFRAEECRPRN